jgi:hypothetical protein
MMNDTTIGNVSNASSPVAFTPAAATASPHPNPHSHSHHTPPLTQWLTFLDVLRTVAREGLPVEQQTRLTEWVGVDSAAAAAAALTVTTADVLRAYFLTPTHRAAIHTLNYALFQSPVPFPDRRAFPMCDILALYSGMGSQRYGRVWGALIDVADASGVPDVGQVRDYIQRQINSSTAVELSSSAATMSSSTAADPSATMAMPTPEQIENIIQPIVTAFPVLGEFVDQMVRPMLAQQQQHFAAAGPGGLGGGGNPMDMVQSVMQNVLAPLLGSMGKSSSSDGADLNGPIQQILSGFTGLVALADQNDTTMMGNNNTTTTTNTMGGGGGVGDQMML